MAASGPGCGGTKPCATDRPAMSGMPRRSTGVPVCRIAVKSTGASSTRPTWKNTGRPMRKPDRSIAQSRRFSPSADTSTRDTTTAPPDSASSLPMTVPSPTTIAMKPSVSPTPC